MRLIRGNLLTPEQRRDVLAAYVNRHTHEHLYPMSGGEPVSDDEWLASKAFYVTDAGKLSRAHNACQPASLAPAVLPAEKRGPLHTCHQPGRSGYCPACP